jgi:hypothetical protein
MPSQVPTALRLTVDRLVNFASGVALLRETVESRQALRLARSMKAFAACGATRHIKEAALVMPSCVKDTPDFEEFERRVAEVVKQCR